MMASKRPQQKPARVQQAKRELLSGPSLPLVVITDGEAALWTLVGLLIDRE